MATYTYTVAGKGPFPMDMLRYDDARGATAADAALIAESVAANDYTMPAYRVTLVGSRKPTAGRWQSFLWRVVGGV